MATVDITWEYTDPTPIDGFKVKRNDIEIADVASNVFTYTDTLTGLTNTTKLGIYEVFVYNSNGEVSISSPKSKVYYENVVSEKHTSANTPANNVFWTCTYNNNVVDGAQAFHAENEGWISFNGGNIYFKLHGNNGPTPFEFDSDIVYEFDSPQRVSAIDFRKENGVAHFNADGTNNILIELYSTDNYSTGTLTLLKTYDLNVTENTDSFQRIELDNVTIINTLVLRVKGHVKSNQIFNNEQINLLSDFEIKDSIFP